MSTACEIYGGLSRQVGFLCRCVCIWIRSMYYFWMELHVLHVSFPLPHACPSSWELYWFPNGYVLHICVRICKGIDIFILCICYNEMLLCLCLIDGENWAGTECTTLCLFLDSVIVNQQQGMGIYMQQLAIGCRSFLRIGLHVCVEINQKGMASM